MGGFTGATGQCLSASSLAVDKVQRSSITHCVNFNMMKLCIELPNSPPVCIHHHICQTHLFLHFLQCSSVLLLISDSPIAFIAMPICPSHSNVFKAKPTKYCYPSDHGGLTLQNCFLTKCFLHLLLSYKNM